MRQTIITILSLLFLSGAYAQQPATLAAVQHISKLEIKKKKRHNIPGRDSSIVLHIDTLIMHDRAHLEFYGRKDVTLQVKHAIIPKRAYISGTDGKNNASDMDISMRFDELGKLYVLAGGRDANNGSRTFPNGDGGEVDFKYLADGIRPQTEDKDGDHYLHIDTEAGGKAVNARSDLYNIYSRIGSGGRPLGQLPQGQVYSGVAGDDGKSEIKEVSDF